MLNQTKIKSNSLYYILLLTVVFIWGIVPVISQFILNYYSPAIKNAFSSIISLIAILIISRKKLKQLNIEYLKIAGVSGLFYSSACILQTIGLTMTTPATYSFLENLSCLIVPVLVWIITKKRPTIYKFLGALLCLISVFILCGGKDGFSAGFGMGELLCSLAGIFYGFNIAITAIKAKKLDAALYLVIQFAIHTIISTTYAFSFETIMFSFKTYIVILMIGITLLSSVFGWLIRTMCLKHIDATLVSVIMPFSSVITTIISVLADRDMLSSNLIWGAILGVISAIIVDFSPEKIFKKKKNTNKEQSLADTK